MKIEKNIPIPARYKGFTAKTPYPLLLKMEMGDSILIPLPKNFVKKDPARVIGSVYSTGKRTGKKFVCRRADGGIRAWRTE